MTKNKSGTLKVCIISIFFPPETGAAASRIFKLAKILAQKDLEVEVITAIPNYPKGEIFSGYKNKLYLKEEIDGITARRFWLYPSNSKNPLLRIISMLSFSFSIFFSLPFLWRWSPNVIIINSPPLISAYSAALLSKLTKSKTVVNVSDIWPLSALELGAISKGKFYSILEKIEHSLYQKSDALISQSEETKHHIEERTIKKKVFLYRNLDVISPYLHQAVPYNREKLKIVYAGLLGVAQGVYGIVESIDFKSLGIELHIYGDGNEKLKIEDYIKKNSASNIFLHDMIPKSEVSKMLTKYHATLIPLKSSIYGAFPSKIYMALSAGMPIFYSGSGEGARFVKKYDLGWINSPSEYKSLEANLKLLSDMGESSFNKLRNNCIRVAKTEFDMDTQGENLIKYITELV